MRFHLTALLLFAPSFAFAQALPGTKPKAAIPSA